MTDSDTTPGPAREASRAADLFRASIERRRETEDLLSEARAARQAAMAEAVEIVRVAEAMARVVEDAARAAAHATLADATARSEQVVARAREEVARLLVGLDPGAERSAPVVPRGPTPEAELERARRGIEELQETALAEVATQQRHAQTAFNEQIGFTIGRLESMASEVQMVLDRAMTELTESLTPLAEVQSSWATEPLSTDGDDARPSAPWHERWRNVFRAPRRSSGDLTADALP